MKRHSLDSALETFSTLFDSAKHEMFKVEVWQDYTAVDDCPSLRAWLAGNKQKAHELAREDENIVAYRNKCLKSPAKITRVHIVKCPYTPYLEWEIAICYKDSLLASGAESISLVEVSKLPKGTILPDGDFWIFDDRQVLQWKYEHGAGKTAGAQAWDESRGDTIDTFRCLKTILLDKAEVINLY